MKNTKIKTKKNNPVVNAIAHQAIFSKMQNFTLASLLIVLPTDLANLLLTFFVSFIYSFSLILHIQQEKLSK